MFLLMMALHAQPAGNIRSGRTANLYLKLKSHHSRRVFFYPGKGSGWPFSLGNRAWPRAESTACGTPSSASARTAEPHDGILRPTDGSNATWGSEVDVREAIC